MTCPEVIYRSRPDATPEGELKALVSAYLLLLTESRNTKGDPATAPEDALALRRSEGVSHVDQRPD